MSKFLGEDPLQICSDLPRARDQCGGRRDGPEGGDGAVVEAGERVTGIGVAVTGTVLAALFTGDFQRRLELGTNGAVPAAVTVAGLTLTVVAAALVGWGFGRARRGGNGLADTS